MIYPAAIRKLITPGARDPRITPRLIVLHVSAGESSSLYPWFNGPSGGIESHFYVTYKGTVEQYRDTNWQADAQLGTAWDGISIETEGLANGTWTAAQLAALAQLLRWISQAHSIPLQLNTSEIRPSGIGWHAQYPAWAGGDGRTCPGPNRIKQIPQLVATAAASTTPREDDMPEPRDLWSFPLTGPDGKYKASAGTWLTYTNDKVDRARRELAALSAAVKALAASHGADGTAVLAAVTAAVNKAMADMDPATIAAEVVKRLPPGGFDQAAVEAAVRNVLGSLDEQATAQ